MAEIRVEERRGSGAWIYIVLILILVAVGVWFVLAREDVVDPTTPPVSEVAPVAPTSNERVGLPGHPPASTMIIVRA